MKWISEGKQPFYTRIGIHFGEAIVGNIGSSERINYTAIGDSINLASRLEGKNKDYNTSILVSDSIYHEIKNDFHLETIGMASVKGLEEPICVYSLIDINKQTANDDTTQPADSIHSIGDTIAD